MQGEMPRKKIRLKKKVKKKIPTVGIRRSNCDIDARNIVQFYSFLQGKLQLSLDKPEKDKYDTFDK